MNESRATRYQRTRRRARGAAVACGVGLLALAALTPAGQSTAEWAQRAIEPHARAAPRPGRRPAVRHRARGRVGSGGRRRRVRARPGRPGRGAAGQIEDRGAGAAQFLAAVMVLPAALWCALAVQAGAWHRRRPLVDRDGGRAGRVPGRGDAGRSGDPCAPSGAAGRSAARRSSSASAPWRAGCAWTSSRLRKCPRRPSVTSTALVAGTGQSRRVFIASDVLRDWSDEEIAVVVAHEFGHHVHHDLWWTLAVDSAVVAARPGRRPAPLLQRGWRWRRVI